MPQEDDETAELEHGEEVGSLIFPSAYQSTEILKPGEQALDFPAAAATQFAAVPSVLPVAIVFVRRDESDASLHNSQLLNALSVFMR
jgi:hypothetical protein